MNDVKCKYCGHAVKRDEPITIVGTASVYGNTTMDSFKTEGIIWSVSDSGDEQWKCPSCEEYNDMP